MLPGLSGDSSMGGKGPRGCLEPYNIQNRDRATSLAIKPSDKAHSSIPKAILPSDRT